MEWREKYKRELAELHEKIAQMGGKTISQLKAGLEVIESGDVEAARVVIEGDQEINRYQAEIEDLGAKLIAMEQPVAQNLREIVSAIKIVSSIERIADHAKHLAKGAERISGSGARKYLPGIREMAEKAIEMLEIALKAFNTQDAELAKKVAAMDSEIDLLKKSLTTRIIQFMKESPDNVEEGASLLFLNRFMERMGDHVTNLCEWVYFTETGDHIELNH